MHLNWWTEARCEPVEFSYMTANSWSRMAISWSEKMTSCRSDTLDEWAPNAELLTSFSSDQWLFGRCEQWCSGRQELHSPQAACTCDIAHIESTWTQSEYNLKSSQSNLIKSVDSNQPLSTISSQSTQPVTNDFIPISQTDQINLFWNTWQQTRLRVVCTAMCTCYVYGAQTDTLGPMVPDALTRTNRTG